MSKPLENLLHKEMSRKEFLLTLGFGMASIMGFASIIKILSSSDKPTRSTGYGSSPYGGHKRF